MAKRKTKERERRKSRALVMFSGGLDSILAVKVLEKQGIKVEGIAFLTPFSNLETPNKSAEMIGLKLHTVKIGKPYFDIVRKPSHGYGANMNPCLDCKAHMMKRAKAYASRIKANFIATGEVLGERPMSQMKNQMLLIERDAGLKGKIVRPLSAKLMPITVAEEKRLVKREQLLDIQGRTRRRQMELARKFRVRKYPAPGGGCLLTDPGFSRKLREFLKHSKELGWDEVELLKVGRHFRDKDWKIIIGRNEKDNNKLLALAKKMKLSWMEVKDHVGPVTLIQGPARPTMIPKALVDRAASMTVLYSDAPYKRVELLYVKGRMEKTIKARPIDKKELDKLRII